MWLNKMLIKDTKDSRSKFTLLIALIIILAVISATDFNVYKEANADVSHNMSGYAWSDTIGWISFNCINTDSCSTLNYGVGINDSNGELFGYAWSSNIGWITFNENELANCPSSLCRARLVNGALTGWARALSYSDTESGGWNGWISFNCIDTGSCSTSNYGVTLSGSEFGGYAWGSAIIGWINFKPTNTSSGVQYGGVIKSTLTASLSSSQTYVPKGNPVTLTWTSTLATSCLGDEFSTDGEVSGEVVVNPNSTTIYTLTCNNDFGSENETLQVSVWDTECSDGIDNDGDGRIDLDDSGCTSYEDDNESSAEFVNLEISAGPRFVQSGGTTEIIWNAEGVDENSCSVSGTNGDFWQGTSGTEETRAITESVTYTLTCLDIEGDPTNSQSITVSLTPVYEEF